MGFLDEGIGTNRAPDLFVLTNSRNRMKFEVKVPVALQQTIYALDQNEARNIVDKAIRKAGTGSRGQLTADHPGILLLGGFHLSDRVLDVLEDASEWVLKKYPTERSHIAGIGILSQGDMIEAPSLNSVFTATTGGSKLSGIVRIRLASNANYDGLVALSPLESPLLQARKVTGETNDFWLL